MSLYSLYVNGMGGNTSGKRDCPQMAVRRRGPPAVGLGSVLKQEVGVEASQGLSSPRSF